MRRGIVLARFLGAAAVLLLAGVLLAGSGALASIQRPRDLGDKIKQCQAELSEARQEVVYAKELQALAERKVKVSPLARKFLGDELPGLIIVNAGSGVVFPIDTQVYVKFLLLEYAAGDLSAAQLSRKLVQLAVAAGRTKRALAQARADAERNAAKLMDVCAALIAKGNPPAKPPPTSGGSFSLTSPIKVAPPSIAQWTINAPAGEFIWDHCCDGGKWKTKFKIVVPDSLSPGRPSPIKLTIEGLEKCDSGSGCNFSIGVNAEGIQGSNQLVASAKQGELAFEEKTLRLTVPATVDRAKDVFITVIVGNGPTLTYTYRHA